MKFLNVIIIMLCLIPGQLSVAQELRRPEQCLAFVPRQLNTNAAPLLSDLRQVSSETGWGQRDTTTVKYWIVYSTGNHRAYALPDDSSAELGTVAVSEKLRVAEIVGDYALVYNEKSPGSVTYPQISGKAEFKGWLHIKHLLLWISCPEDSAGVCRKAFVGEEELTRLVSQRSLSCHYGKSSGQGFDNFPLYVYDETPDSLLLGRCQTLTGRYDDEILGWVGKNNVLPWDNRICIEPVWDADSVAALAAANECASLYADALFLHRKGGYKYHVAEKKDNLRLPMNVFRFPLMKEDSISYQVILPSKCQFPFDNMEYVAGQAVYTPKSGKARVSHWREVLMISTLELSNALRRLAPVLSVVNGSAGDMEDRSRFVDAIIQAGDVFGIGRSVSPEAAAVLDTDFVSTEDFLSVMRKYRLRCEELSQISRSSKKNYCMIGDMKYYLIPLSELP